MKLKLSLEKNEFKEFADEELLSELAKKLLKIFGQEKAKISLSVFYVDLNKIQEINKEYRGMDKVTDVISFRYVDNPKNLTLDEKNFPLEFDGFSKTIYLGEIFISPEVAKNQAKEFGNSAFREVLELFIHGVLHILGCDHHQEKEAEFMKGFELEMEKVLDQMKIF